MEEALAAERVAEADVAAMRQKVNAQEAAVKQMQAAVTAAGSGVRQAEAEAVRAEAEAKQARLNLSYTKIYAPISGHVTRKERRERDSRADRSTAARPGRS